ncbi:MAG: VOC family protein [Geminicoccaceae bacterium]|nr:MAG: VOC family protein [Geminicoccaceae bacterium]
MLSHVTIGVGDLGRARAFYDALMQVLGIGRIVDEPEHGLVGYGHGPQAAPQFYLCRPLDGQPPSVGNGQTFAFLANDRTTVDRFHARALAAGGRCEGAPGLRPHYHPDYYGTYVRDLDGHKLCCVCHLPPA